MRQLLIVGEIFWDQFENGSIHQGGSALNLAWHLKGLGVQPHFISRVGSDPYGQKFIGTFAQWGLSVDFLQVDSQHPTGIVHVLLDANRKPTFVSPPIAALDFIQYENAFDKFPADSILYHGSFILRNEVSRETIARMKSRGFPVFMDLNLRNPYWNRNLLDEWVRDLEIFKLSEEEFARLSDMSGDLHHLRQIEWLQEWMKSRSIRNIIFTIGEKGSFWIEKEEIHFEPAKKVTVENSVGAGDAYCAGILFSSLEGLSIPDTMKKSTQFAAEVCKLPGATSTEKEFYKNCRTNIWNL